VLKYALRNALIPVVSVSAAQLGYMLAGSVVVESVFAINGAGRLAWESILRSDLPTVQALVLCFSLIYVILTFLADVLNAWLDPRMRLADVRND
jgi:peptide/nickel transport system permease protein